MSDIYFVESTGSDSATPIGSSGEYYLVEGRGQVSKYGASNQDTSLTLSSQSRSIPSYLETTAYGERFRVFSNSYIEDFGDVALASKFNLPQIFPSRNAAELDAMGRWRHFGNDQREVGIDGNGSVANDISWLSNRSSSILNPTSANDSGTSSHTQSTNNSGSGAATRFRLSVPSIQNFTNLMDKSNNNSSQGSDDSPFLSRKAMGLPHLPTRWAKLDQGHEHATISPNGYEITFEYDSKLGPNDTVSVRTDYPIPQLCGIYYFEIEITNQGAGEFVGIGLCDEEVSLTKVPGLDHKSWGYHSDDGRITACQGTAKQYGPKFGSGDVIGCAINFKKNSVFYTKNGLPLPTAFQDVKGTLYPCVGIKKGISVYANFGQDEFRFDIEKYVRDQKKRVMNSINSRLIEGIFNPEREMTDFLKDLVSQYFNHEGFLETAKVFKQERNREETSLVDRPSVSSSQEEMDISDPGQSTEEMNDKASIDVQNRYRIRKMVLEGDIDGALKFLNVFYPQILEDNSIILFKLRSRKFVELIRKSIPGNIDIEMTDAVTSNASNVSTTELTAESNNIMPVTDATSSSLSSSSSNTDNNGSNSSILVAIEYGQKLRQDYKNDERPFVVEHLSNIFSLLAYEDPSTSREFSYLLDREELIPLAEELNSTLLASQGKPSVPALRKVAEQAIQLTWELSDQGYSAANLISVDKDFLEVDL